MIRHSSNDDDDFDNDNDDNDDYEILDWLQEQLTRYEVIT